MSAQVDISEAAPLGPQAALERLLAMRAAATEVLERIGLVAICASAPAGVLDAAVVDLNASADALATLGVEPGTPRLGEIAAAAPPALAAELRTHGAELREAMRRIQADSMTLALELGRRRADTEEVIRLGTGAPGTYDARGRTTLDVPRRTHGVI